MIFIQLTTLKLYLASDVTEGLGGATGDLLPSCAAKAFCNFSNPAPRRYLKLRLYKVNLICIQQTGI